MHPALSQLGSVTSPFPFRGMECGGGESDVYVCPGVGIFAKKKLSAQLSAVCGGKNNIARTEVTKLMWKYSLGNK